MSAGPSDDIDRLLGLPDDAGRDPRLVADLSQALAGAPAGAADPEDIAGAAAYLDGGLTGARRDQFAARLAASPTSLADLESAAAFLDAARTHTAAPPPHLAAAARARFAEAADALPREQRRRWAFALPSGRTLGWAVAAAAAVVVIAPLSIQQIRIAPPPAGTPEVSQASAGGGPGPGVLAIQPAAPNGSLASLGPVPSAAPMPAPRMPAKVEPSPMALAKAKADNGIVAVSDRCAAEGEAPRRRTRTPNLSP